MQISLQFDDFFFKKFSNLFFKEISPQNLYYICNNFVTHSSECENDEVVKKDLQADLITVLHQ